MPRIAFHGGHSLGGLGDLVHPILQPPELRGRGQRGQLESIIAAPHHVDGCVTPISEFHQPTFEPNHAQAVDDGHCAGEVTLVGHQPVGLAEVRQITLDEVGPSTEIGSDTAGSHGLSEVDEPRRVTTRRQSKFGVIRDRRDVLTDRLENAMSNVDLRLLANHETGVLEFFECVDDIQILDVVSTGDRLRAIERDTSDDHGQPCQHRPGDRRELTP